MFKNKFKILLESKIAREEALCKYLFWYRTNPHCTTGKTPAELHVGRKLRTKLDALKPSTYDNVLKQQNNQKSHFRGNRVIEFKENEFKETVVTKNSQFSNFSYIIKSQQHFHYFILKKKYVQWFTVDFYFSWKNLKEFFVFKISVQYL